MPFRKPGLMVPEGDSGNYKRVNGRHIFVPTADESAEDIGDKEVERWEHPTPSFKTEEEKKFQSVEDNLNVRNIHADGAKESETYIGEPSKESNKMPDKNKIADVQLNDTIKYFLNGEEGSGKVYAMTNNFFTVRKESGGYQDIQVSDIFFVDQILPQTTKTWAHMPDDERAEVLSKARCPLSFITRDWADMPSEVQAVIKSNFERGMYGGVDTTIHFDTPKDSGYESVPNKDTEANFKYDCVKPDTEDTEKEQVPNSFKKPEIKVTKDGNNAGSGMTAMMSGVKSEDDEEEKEKGSTEEEIQNGLQGGGENPMEEKKENASMSSGDSGSFNAVHGERRTDEKENHIGKNFGNPQANQFSGLGYGITKLKKNTDLED